MMVHLVYREHDEPPPAPGAVVRSLCSRWIALDDRPRRGRCTQCARLARGLSLPLAEAW